MTSLSAAFDDLITRIISLEAACLTGRARAAVLVMRRAALEKVVTTIAILEDRHVIDETQYLRTRDAYRSVLALGMLFDEHIRKGRDVPALEHTRARASIDAMLDAFTPYVQQKEDAMRRVMLDHISIDAAVGRLHLAD